MSNFIKLLSISALMSSTFMTQAADNHWIDDDEQIKLAMALSLADLEPIRNSNPQPNNHNKQNRANTNWIDDNEGLEVAIALSLADLEPIRNINPQPNNHTGQIRAEEIKIVTKPSDNHLELARYILRRPSLIQGMLNGFFENELQFIEMPFCHQTYNKIDLPSDIFEAIKIKAQSEFESYCRDKNFNYDAALPLFTHFWKDMTANTQFCLFSDTYKKMVKILKDNETLILDLLYHEQLFAKKLAELGITNFYETLKRDKDTICKNYTHLLTNMTPEQLLAQGGPKIGDNLLGWKEPVMNQTHIETKEKKDDKPQLIHRPALDVSILRFQQLLHKEFEDRQGKGGDETVMAYGNIVAKYNHRDIETHINEIWKQLNHPNMRAQSVVNIEEIIKLHDTVKGKEDLEHSAVQAKAIRSSLETSFKRHTNERLMIYLVDKTQYDYLLMVTSQVFRFNQIFREENKTLANTLLGIFFDQLIQQEGRCQAGMIGRLLVVHKTTLDMLIEYYNSPIK